MELYENSRALLEERAGDLLGKMTLEEKMGQVRCVFAIPERPDAVENICKDGIGEISTLFITIKGLFAL